MLRSKVYPSKNTSEQNCKNVAPWLIASAPSFPPEKIYECTCISENKSAFMQSCFYFILFIYVSMSINASNLFGIVFRYINWFLTR